MVRAIVKILMAIKLPGDKFLLLNNRVVTDIENYKTLLDKIFGVASATFDPNNPITNNVIGALNHPTEFVEFRNNFTERLYRLKDIYSTHPDYLKEILVQLNLIANPKNWEGAFAELVAFDHLNKDILKRKTYLSNPIKPNITIDKSRTFADELGKKEANLDGYAEDIPLYFDVKCFKDNVKEILEGLYKEIQIHFAVYDLNIMAEYALDVSYDDFQKNRNSLLNELQSAIDVNKKTPFVKSKIIPTLNYRIHWGAGIQTAERSYHPYSHAENFHKVLFSYANKFVKDEASLIVLVIFPWYNPVISDFANANRKLYRAIARRVFCQYKYDQTKFKIFNPNFKGEQTIYQVSNHLSGIIFLEDHTILSKESNKTNVKSFVYLNPNATIKISNSFASGFLLGLGDSEFDDFEHDNY